MTATTVCPTCSLPVPEERLDVLSGLARYPVEGVATEALARILLRRAADVRTELRDLADRGVIERMPAAGRSHAQRWRLTPSGRPSDGRQSEVIERPGSAAGRTPERRRCLEKTPSAVTERIAVVTLIVVVLLALTAGASVAIAIAGHHQ